MDSSQAYQAALVGELVAVLVVGGGIPSKWLLVGMLSGLAFVPSR